MYLFNKRMLVPSVLIMMLGVGCKKFVDVPLPISQLSTEATFADDGKAHSAMRGIYATMTYVLSTGPFAGGLNGNLGMTSDELVRLTYSADQQLFFDNNLNASSSGNQNSIWAPLYNYLYQANNVYANVEKSTGVTPGTKNELMGEARFLRALCHFYLVNLYDSIPLVLTPDYRTNALLAREAPAKVYDQILKDLQFAQQNMSLGYTAQGTRLRPNVHAATALLARVQLYLKNWPEAEKQASSVINAGPYILDSLGGVFLTISRETIFSVGNAGSNIYTMDASRISGASTTNGAFRLSSYTLDAFEPNDQRKVAWTRNGTGTGAGSVAPFKYKVFANTPVVKSESTVMLRLAEQYLIRAEARAWQNKLPEAIADVDSLRKRAGLPLISVTNPTISKDDLLAAIAKERVTELFAEMGHRWFDILRTGQATAILGTRKVSWKKDAALFPIPKTDRDANPNLTQNSGY